MSRKARKQVSFSPDVYERSSFALKHGGKGGREGKRKKFVRILAFIQPKRAGSGFSAAASLLKQVSTNVCRVLGCFSMPRKCSPKVSSSNLVRSRSMAESIESHRAEAIEDCIEFLNSSSSLSRSNSVTSCS